VPAAVGVNDVEVTLELSPLDIFKVIGAPSWVPPVHSVGEAAGPHSKKVTVPVGAPPVALPVTVATSVTEPPRTMEPEPEADVDCCVVVTEGAGVTLKHSLSLCCHTDE
jgi:hypothetical protein